MINEITNSGYGYQIKPYHSFEELQNLLPREYIAKKIDDNWYVFLKKPDLESIGIKEQQDQLRSFLESKGIKTLSYFNFFY